MGGSATRNSSSDVLINSMIRSYFLFRGLPHAAQGQLRDAKLIKTPGMSNILIRGQVHEFMVGDTRHPLTAEIHALLHQLWQDMKDTGFSPTLSAVHDMSDEEKYSQFVAEYW